MAYKEEVMVGLGCCGNNRKMEITLQKGYKNDQKKTTKTIRNAALIKFTNHIKSI